MNPLMRVTFVFQMIGLLLAVFAAYGKSKGSRHVAPLVLLSMLFTGISWAGVLYVMVRR